MKWGKEIAYSSAETCRKKCIQKTDMFPLIRGQKDPKKRKPSAQICLFVLNENKSSSGPSKEFSLPAADPMLDISIKLRSIPFSKI